MKRIALKKKMASDIFSPIWDHKHRGDDPEDYYVKKCIPWCDFCLDAWKRVKRRKTV